jgi:hypothetical protein
VYNFAGQVDVEVAVSSVTFTDLGTGLELVGVDMLWVCPSTGARRLDMQINGKGPPAGSRMSRDQFDLSLGTREDRLDPGLTVADLIAGIDNTVYRGAVYIQSGSAHNEGVLFEGEGYAQDASVVRLDRERFSRRMGRWASVESEINSVSLAVAGGTNNIGVGSVFRAYTG